VDLRLVVPGVIQPPLPRVDPPQPRFTVSGNTGVLTNVVFDASTTLYDRGVDQDPAPDFVTCGALCTYSWDFGDGATGSGIFATHQYSRVGNYQVRLTVTDPYGQTASAAQTVSIGAGGQPTATFTFSPQAPSVNQQVFFTAEASRAAPGRQIVSYDWNFGSGRTGTGVTIRQTFGTPGTYVVTLTVTDDAGNQATTTQSVNVSLVGTLQAVLQVSPTTGGNTSTTYQFDGAQSTPGAAPIVEYRFNFGDSTPDVVTTVPVTTHRFTTPGSYQVSLQIRDSQGRTSVARLTVSVAAPPVAP
jgi:PKD repeat protein